MEISILSNLETRENSKLAERTRKEKERQRKPKVGLVSNKIVTKWKKLSK